MKAKTFYSIARLTAAAFLALTLFTLTSCSKDEEEEEDSLIGLWELERRDGTIESYWFDETGVGKYENPSWTGSFTYNIESPGHIRFRIAYRQWVGGNASYRDEFVWPYQVKGEKLILNGYTYTLKTRVIETIVLE